MLLGDGGDVVEGRGGLPALGGGDEAEVAGGHVHRDVAGEHAPHGHADGLDGSAGLVAVAGGARLVEHHADDVEVGVDGREPVDGRGHGPGGRADVDDEQDGGAGQRGDVGARGETVGAEAPVHEAHDALEHRDVRGGRVGGPPGEQRLDEVLADEPRVEGAARPAGGERVVAGVDVVRADLGRGHGQSTAGEGGHDPHGDRRLAVARRGRRDEHPGEGHHSMPFWPF